MNKTIATISVLGLSKKQIEEVENLLKTEPLKLTYYDSLNDFISSQAKILIVNSKFLNDSEKETFLNFYSGIYNKKDIIVYWLNYPAPPHPYRARINCSSRIGEIIHHINTKFNESERQM